MKTIIKLLVCLSLVLTVACQNDGEKTEVKKEVKKQAKLIYCPWDEGIAFTYAVKAVLEDEMNYEVEEISMDVALAYMAVADGQADAYMETWSILHGPYLKKYEGKVKAIGAWYKNTTVGLTVPKYVSDAGIKTISDLTKPGVAKKLGGKIVGFEAGAGMMMDIEDKIIPMYGLKKAGIELAPSSVPALMASLKKAIKKKEWIVVAGWKPHTMYKHYELTILEEDKDKIWGNEDLQVTARHNLETDKPELYKFLNNASLTDAQLMDLMMSMEDKSKEPLQIAKEWLAKNPDVAKAWVAAVKK